LLTNVGQLCNRCCTINLSFSVTSIRLFVFSTCCHKVLHLYINYCNSKREEKFILIKNVFCCIFITLNVDEGGNAEREETAAVLRDEEMEITLKLFNKLTLICSQHCELLAYFGELSSSQSKWVDNSLQIKRILLSLMKATILE